MHISHVVTSVNDNPKYTKFIPSFIESWKAMYPSITPIIVYVGKLPIDAYLNRFKDNIVSLEIDSSINTVFASQSARMLYTCLINTDSAVMISDIDMMPCNKTYFNNELLESIPDNAMVSFRPKSAVDEGQIAMCYVAGKPHTWRSVFGINTESDLTNFLARYSHINFDGIHGGNGWYTDQQLLYEYASHYNGGLVFLSDHDMNYNRLDIFHHNYNRTHMCDLIKTGFFSDSHFYGTECPFVDDDITEICKIYNPDYQA
jgi:hypothetical protein